MPPTTLLRRSLLGAAVLLAPPSPGRAQEARTLRVFRTPGCGCCAAWAEHFRRAGFEVTLRDTPTLEPIRRGAGVPDDLAGCHTGFLGDLVVEGHVPPLALRRLLADAAAWRGLAVPGMPVGSPGMEVPGVAAAAYDVVAFAAGGRRRTLGTFRGLELA